MAIEEQIVLDVDAGGLNDAASAADDLASALADVDDAAGVDTDGVDGLTDAASEAADALEDAADAAEQAGDAAESGGQDGAAAFSDMAQAATGIGAALGILEKVGKAASKVLDVAIAFGGAVIAADAFNNSAEAALSQLTDGRGVQALSNLSTQAAVLGISTESAVDQFKALREAGANNADAQALISMRADLEAVGASSEQADAAVKAVLDQVKKGASSADAIASIAHQFGAVGDGSDAAAYRTTTLQGALDNISAFKTRAFESLASDAAGPLNAIGAKITSVLDSFESSGAMADAGATLAAALEYVPPIIDGMLAAWDSFKASAEPGIAALSLAFDQLSGALGDTGSGMGIASAIGSALGTVISVIANTIAGAVAVIAGFIAAWDAVSGGVSAAVDAVSGAIDAIGGMSLAEIGTALVQGFVDGIMGMVGAVMDAAAAIGDAAGGAIKGALGIASPSKVGLEIGGNLGESVGTGVEDAMPPEIEPPTLAELPAGPAANTNGGGGASGNTINVDVQIVINGSGPGGSVTTSDIEAATRRGVADALRAAGLAA